MRPAEQQTAKRVIRRDGPTPSAATWYPTLHKPAFNPLAWVFTPVWTVLYVMIAIAGWVARAAVLNFALWRLN